jgi:hypothetical protein
MKTRIPIFGSQNGAELVARVRYQQGHTGVPDHIAQHVAALTVPQATAFMAERITSIKFVDVLPMCELPYWEDAYVDDVENGKEPTYGVYTVVAMSRIQPAASVRVTVDGESVETTRLMCDESGHWETVSVERPTADERRAYDARYYGRK